MTAQNEQLNGMMHVAILERNRSKSREEYEAMERVINALLQHPYFVALKAERLEEMTNLTAEDRE